jgi:hypothetical protein
LGTAELVNQDQTFERRYYETMRRQKLAAEVGRIATHGLERRRYEEITSGLAEALPGVVKTSYEFDLEQGKLVAADGQSIEELLLKGRENDHQKAEEDDFYKAFLPQRSEYEVEEFYEQEAMANNETNYNTLVTFSPYSEEYDSESTRAKITKAGQKPYWKRGMLRISHWDGNRLHIATRSVDNSSIGLFKQVTKEHFSHEFEAKNSTEMLGERIRLSIEDESWQDLADSVVKTADKILSEKFGDKRIQGRSEKEAKDLQTFVESETQIIDSLLQIGRELSSQHPTFESYKQAFNDEMYNHISLLKKRLELGTTEKIVDISAASEGAGASARAEGTVYDMCGNVISPNTSTSQVATQTGFETLARLSNKEVQCPFCKEKVVVPKADLDKGKLYCKECDTGVDVCTGEKFSKGRKANKSPKKYLSFFEIITEDFARIKHEEKLKRLKEEEDNKLKKAA